MNRPVTELRVLIADDDAILREIAAATLQAAGFQVQCVASGDSAVAACALRKPDIALLDVEMADGNGLQACTNIRALPGGTHLPIVMVTGRDDAESISQAYAAGATDFVLKPIQWPLLTLRIRHLLRNAGDNHAPHVGDLNEPAAEMRRLAYFDTLTGLPNRQWLAKYLALTLDEARRLKRHVALLYVNLDRFKRINETLGHDTGDALLCQVAERLKTALYLQGDGDPSSMVLGVVPPAPEGGERLCGQLARVGGDEFVVVLTGRTDLRGAEAAAKQTLAMHAAPFLQSNYELAVSPSVGVAVFPEHGSDARNLLKNAEAAMYAAKSSGRNRLRVYDGAANARVLKRLSLEAELRRAVEDSSLDVYYQPTYVASTLKVAGSEALLRWFHPERGQIPTADFIAVAEETGLIADIGRWTLQRVCRDLANWRADGIALPRVAVNVSGRDLIRAEALLRMSDTVLRASLPPALFELELTESVLMLDAEASRLSLLSLKEFGFALAVDDFGTGYCSLSYLKRFPLDTLKIDRSFVADISEDPDDAAVVRAIIALGHSLDLRIVAEGVETSAQLQFLQAERCDAMQGFLMSAAVPAVEFAAMLHDPLADTVRADSAWIRQRG